MTPAVHRNLALTVYTRVGRRGHTANRTTVEGRRSLSTYTDCRWATYIYICMYIYMYSIYIWEREKDARSSRRLEHDWPLYTARAELVGNSRARFSTPERLSVWCGDFAGCGLGHIDACRNHRLAPASLLPAYLYLSLPLAQAYDAASIHGLSRAPATAAT